MSSRILVFSMMAAAFLMISASSIIAQENFSGKWAFNESKSTIGQAPAVGQAQAQAQRQGGQGQGQMRLGGMMRASELNITQQGNSLTVERTRQGRDGQSAVTTEKYDLTGKISENAMMNNTRKSIVSWSSDKKVMTIKTTTTMNFQGETRDINTQEIWKMSEGGKVLLIETINTTPNGEMKNTLAYDKK
ncbi:MAG: hypothetical protein FJY11_05310 [Bacteroidetes bacterium]|nr:hypothetical protein [Bacteroidota bacterium]